MYVKAAQAEQTRKTLCSKARGLFAKKGYTDVSIEEIVRSAGVTKGALYHHFPDKLQLFRAIVEDMQRELVARINTAAIPHDDPFDRLEAMCNAYLDSSLNPEQRLLVLDAPVVLGWKAWCDLDHEYSVGALTTCLDEAMKAHLIETQPAETLAQVLLGALNNAARVITTAAEPTVARTNVGGSIKRLVAGLRL